MVILRGLGFTQKQIARRLGLTQETVSYHLRKLREAAARQGPAALFFAVVLGPLGAGAMAAKIVEEVVGGGRKIRRGWGMEVE